MSSIANEYNNVVSRNVVIEMNCALSCFNNKLIKL